MARPALIIGLGGTGQWVLTYLKKDLLEANNGVMPTQVKLLCFDTTTRTTAETSNSPSSRLRAKEEEIQVGGIKVIEGKEFIPIGGNFSTLASEIAAGKHSHLRWFPASSFLSKLPPAAFNTKEGSGQIRQMGRMSLFRDLASFNRSEVLSHLRANMQDLQKNVSRDMQLEIIVVGSLAGGTGAGMLVDMAYLVRAQASQLVANNYVVRGIFVLPRAFVAGGLGEGRDMLARSFAAWRELDRFMVVSERFGLRQMNYHESNQELRFHIDRRAYDATYMVDPARQTVNSLDNVRAEEGLFPSIADTISAILDEKAGREYTEFVTTNLAGKLAQLPRRPYHSTIGSYTLKVPEYYAREKFFHKFVLLVLGKFLSPQTNFYNGFFNVSGLSNLEVPESQNGIQSALRFMSSSSLNISGHEIPNTRFLSIVAEIRESAGLANNSLKQHLARGYLTSPQSRYRSALTDISQDIEGERILRSISYELDNPIWRDVPPSREAGDTPDTAFSRIKTRIPQVRQERFGIDTASGERLRGKYGNFLEEAKAAQVARFKRLLQAWTLQMLNGDPLDPQFAGSGKVGFVRSFYVGLIDNFDYFVKFLNSVRQIRNEELRLAIQTRQSADAALNIYERIRGKKCWLTFWDGFIHPDAYDAQRKYLQAEQRDIDVRKDDVFLDVLAETALEMRTIAEKNLNDLLSWIKHLATGDKVQQINSLYSEVLNSLANVDLSHELDKRLNKISQLITEYEYGVDEAFVIEALGRIKWQIIDTVDEFNINCGIEFPTDSRSQTPTFASFQRQGENSSKSNLALLMQLAQYPFNELIKDHSLAREVMKVYPSGRKLAEVVDRLAEPLYMPASVTFGPEVVACHICVKSNANDETTRYFAEFVLEMTQRNTHIRGSSLRLVDSEDQYKMTIVRSDDLITSTDFQMWHACRDAYIHQVTDPHRGIPAAELHVFPAEINACAYESEIPNLLGKNYKLLDPEVVAILEDKERFEMFLKAYALGFIKVIEGDGIRDWTYKLPGDQEILYLNKPIDSLFGNQKEDLFQVIHNFVMEGVDQRPNLDRPRHVDWDKLKDAIYNVERGVGKTKITKLYRQQIENSKGLVSMILAENENRRAMISDQMLRRSIGQEFEDLADVAKVVFYKAIFSLENSQIPKSRSNNKNNIRDFASEAGFKIINTDSPNIFELIPDTSVFAPWLSKPILAFQILQQLDPDILTKIISDIQNIKKDGKEYENIVFIATSATISGEITQLFSRIRAEKGIWLVSIHEIWVRGELVRSQLIDIFGPQRDLYDRRVPVSDPLNFFGRESIVKDLRTRVQNCEAVGLFGLRKIGKSSLLRYLRSTATFPVAHVDLQAGTDCAGVFDRALQSWTEKVRDLRILWNPEAIRAENMVSNFSNAVSLLRQSSLSEGKGIPVLLIDEIELIFPDENDSDKLQNYFKFSRMLRGLAQEGHLGLIFAGVDATINKRNFFGKEQNPFYHFLVENYLGPISLRDCEDMIAAIGDQMGLSYTPDALSQIVRASGGHPFIARQICSAVYKSLAPRKRKIIIADVKNTLVRFISNSTTSNFLDEQGLWGEMTNQSIWDVELAQESEKILLWLAENGPLSKEKIMIYGGNKTDTEKALQEMEQRGLLENQNDIFTIRMQVFLNWIRRYKLDKPID